MGRIVKIGLFVGLLFMVAGLIHSCGAWERHTPAPQPQAWVRGDRVHVPACGAGGGDGVETTVLDRVIAPTSPPAMPTAPAAYQAKSMCLGTTSTELQRLETVAAQALPASVPGAVPVLVEQGHGATDFQACRIATRKLLGAQYLPVDAVHCATS